MTKKITIAALGMMLLGGGAVQAQKAAPKFAATTPVPDLTKVDLEKMLQQLQTKNVNAQADSQEVSPLQVVAQFLQLRPAQASQLEQLLQARQTTIAPLVIAAQTLTQELAVMLNSGGNPTQIGTALVQIHMLQEQIAQVQQAFLTQFVSTLDAEQLQRLQAVQIGAQVQPVLPAFAPIFLF